MKYSSKDHKDRNKHKNRRRKKKERASSVDLCQEQRPQHLHHVKVSPRGQGRPGVDVRAKNVEERPFLGTTSPGGRVSADHQQRAIYDPIK